MQIISKKARDPTNQLRSFGIIPTRAQPFLHLFQFSLFAERKEKSSRMSENRRGQFRIFVGNTQQVSYSDIREKFSEFGKVAEVDLKG